MEFELAYSDDDGGRDYHFRLGGVGRRLNEGVWPTKGTPEDEAAARAKAVAIAQQEAPHLADAIAQAAFIECKD